MKDNKNNNKQTYKCAICGEVYNTIEGRARCESNCIRNCKEAERIDRYNEYQEKKNASEARIDVKMNELNNMIQDHISNYKELTIDKPYYFLRYVLRKPFFWFV